MINIIAIWIGFGYENFRMGSRRRKGGSGVAYTYGEGVIQVDLFNVRLVIPFSYEFHAGQFPVSKLNEPLQCR